MYSQFKPKIINDPVYGFINAGISKLMVTIIDSPYFQRLRRISQLGLSSNVYPGAMHSRFQHTLGATHLMISAISELRKKGFNITEEEEEASALAILLHDIGHGPFSHTLEGTILKNVSHEDISLCFMKSLNNEYDGALDKAIEIFTGTYHKKYLHQLVSGQLDVDRLDYLCRDSFYTGVTDGIIATDRIIKMLTIANNELAVEEKAIYSIENFLIARRLMYWQVYMHKTVLSAEHMLRKIFKRVDYLLKNDLLESDNNSLSFFLENNFTCDDFYSKPELLDKFASLDDGDIYYALKKWSQHNDKVLSGLCNRILNRKLFRVKLQDIPFPNNEVDEFSDRLIKKLGLSEDEAGYYVFSGSVENNAYSVKSDKINILRKNGDIVDIAEASDMLDLSVLSKTVKKYFICHPKTFEI